MTDLTINTNNTAAVTAPYRTAATTAGRVDSRVSRQWATRPDDEKFTSLSELQSFLQKRDDRSFTEELRPENAEVVVDDDADDIFIRNRANGRQYDLTHWSFGQACRLVGAPASYLRNLPSGIGAINLQYGLQTKRGLDTKAYVGTNGDDATLRALTSPSYGRIRDSEIISAVRQIAGDGTGDTRWKVPGVIDWGTSNGVTVQYNPFVDITKENTTLYASDRDVWAFLVDDTHPIAAGVLPNGEPDYLFRGFMVSNSEVGAAAFNLEFFLLRGVCQNRNLWGVESTRSLKIRHTSGAPEKFLREAAPALLAYSEQSTAGIIEKVNAAKGIKIGDNKEQVLEFITDKTRLSREAAERAIRTGEREEGKPVRSVWDVVQAITASARGLQHQDDRVALERTAGRLMNRV